MKIRLQSLILGILICTLIIRCNTNSTSNKTDEFDIYSTTEVLDSTNGTIKTIPIVERKISIPTNLNLDEKINCLLDSISKYCFNNLKIQSLGVFQNNKGYKTLKINLLENPGFKIPDSLGKYHSWYDFFQGSTGGQQTTITLTESILQRNYKGKWIDQIEFYYQNDTIGDWDHIALSGQIKRK